MFGTLTAQTELLTEEQLARYRACYCGLCRSLKERYGQLGRLLLNYDLCFLVLLLDSLYEPETAEGAAPCLAHPREARPWRRSAFSDYAADMTVALAYHKFRDNWQDEGSLLSLGGAAALKRAYQKARHDLPDNLWNLQASCTDPEKFCKYYDDRERSEYFIFLHLKRLPSRLALCLT